MPETAGRVLRAHLGMLLWALIIGLSFPAVGLLTPGLPPLLLTALRFAIAVLALIPLLPRSRDLRPGLPGFALYLAMGLTLAGFFGAMFWAAHRATALSMATLYVSVPLLTYGLGRTIGVEPRAGALLSILTLGAAGALGLAWAEAGGFGRMQFGWGEAVFFAGCVASALYPVLTKWGLNRRWLSESAVVRSFWSLAIGSVAIALIGLTQEAPAALAALMTWTDALVILWLGVASSSLTFWLQQRATAVLTPGAVTAYSYLAPFVSMLLLFAGEPWRMGWHWLPGSLMVLLAIALLLRRDAAGRRQPAEAGAAE